MKKSTRDNIISYVVALILMVALCFGLAACEGNRLEKQNEEANIKSFSVKSSYTTQLVYDEDTHIVYMRSVTYHGYNVITPYYSENGKLLRYENGELVEIN